MAGVRDQSSHFSWANAVGFTGIILPAVLIVTSGHCTPETELELDLGEA